MDNETLDIWSLMDVLKEKHEEPRDDSYKSTTYNIADLAKRLSLAEAKIVSLETKLNGR